MVKGLETVFISTIHGISLINIINTIALNTSNTPGWSKRDRCAKLSRSGCCWQPAEIQANQTRLCLNSWLWVSGVPRWGMRGWPVTFALGSAPSEHMDQQWNKADKIHTMRKSHFPIMSLFKLPLITLSVEVGVRKHTHSYFALPSMSVFQCTRAPLHAPHQ